MKATPETRLKELLATTHSLELATTGGPVSPWVAAAYFAEEGLFLLMLMLEGGGATVGNLRAHPQVAVMLQQGDAFQLFAQASGRALVVEETAAEGYRRAISTKAPEGAQLVALPGLVPVRLEIDTWRLTDVPGGWLPAREVRRPGAPQDS